MGNLSLISCSCYSNEKSVPIPKGHGKIQPWFPAGSFLKLLEDLSPDFLLCLPPFRAGDGFELAVTVEQISISGCEVERREHALIDWMLLMLISNERYRDVVTTMLYKGHRREQRMA